MTAGLHIVFIWWGCSLAAFGMLLYFAWENSPALERGEDTFTVAGWGGASAMSVSLGALLIDTGLSYFL